MSNNIQNSKTICNLNSNMSNINHIFHKNDDDNTIDKPNLTLSTVNKSIKCKRLNTPTSCKLNINSNVLKLIIMGEYDENKTYSLYINGYKVSDSYIHDKKYVIGFTDKNNLTIESKSFIDIFGGIDTSGNKYINFRDMDDVELRSNVSLSKELNITVNCINNSSYKYTVYPYHTFSFPVQFIVDSIKFNDDVKYIDTEYSKINIDKNKEYKYWKGTIDLYHVRDTTAYQVSNKSKLIKTIKYLYPNWHENDNNDISEFINHSIFQYNTVILNTDIDIDKIPEEIDCEYKYLNILCEYSDPKLNKYLFVT